MRFIIYLGMIVAVVAAVYFYTSSPNKEIVSNIGVENINNSKACSKDYPKENIDGRKFVGEISVLDEELVKYEGKFDGVYEINILNACTSKVYAIYAGAPLPPGSPFVYVPQAKVLLSFVGHYDADLGAIYYQNLSQFGTSEYNKISVPLNADETLVKQDLPCGDGCDRETRVYSARVAPEGVLVDVFQLASIGDEAQPRRFVRTILLKPEYLMSQKQTL